MTGTAFTHTVEGAGPAQGMTVTGKHRPVQRPAAADIPLVIAVHGGTYTSDYFDVPGYSLLDRAAELGVPIMAVDRPGYRGSTPVGPADSTIMANAEVLGHAIGELWELFGAGTAGVFLIGHSIGGAVVTAVAAAGPSWPLLGIAVSGCLLDVPAANRAKFTALPDIPLIELPAALKDAVMFGPEWTYDQAVMPQASHPSGAPAPRGELVDINTTWTDAVNVVAAQVKVPVHSRQAAFDALWITDAGQVSAFAAAFTGAPFVDARLVPSAGHCIDFHRAGAGFQLSQLGFALECCVRT
jgi:pimeloyl-ACP methyl ester carboxylesterase